MYDLVIIGSGPAGYVAAERAGEMGKKVLLVEKERNLGGVCLNSGCIPTKSMLFSAKLYHHALHAEAFGVTVSDAGFDYSVVKARAEGVQANLRKGIQGLMKKNKVEVVRGAARIIAPGTIAVEGREFAAANLLIATGSRAFMPPIDGLADNPRVVTNVGILAQDRMPDHLCIIGAGVIGTEFAALYTMAGRQVTMIEMLPQVCGNTDRELARMVQKKLEKQGAKIHLDAKVTSVTGGTVAFIDKKGQKQSVDAELILVATGRATNTEGLGLETIGVDFDRVGIKVNDRAMTNVPGVYAAGDVTGRWQLAHFASRQATVAVNNMFGRPDVCRENAVPAVIYTDPEVACVGMTEEQAKEQGIPVKAVKYPLGASGRFLAETNAERGVLKAVFCRERGTLLGMHIAGPYASEMIGAACAMIETELRAKDIREIIFPHPTVSELMRDAAWGV